MTDHLLTLQTAAYGALSGSTELMTQIDDIYDTVPEKAKGTYVEIGELQAFERGTKDTDSWRVLIDFHVWSDKTEKAYTHNVLSLIRAPLHGAALDLAPYSLTSIREQSRRVMTDVGDDLVHGIITFVALMQA